MTFPAVELPVVVELMLDGSWVDITAAGDVLLRNDITITRGQANEQPALTASTCSLTLKNDAGKYSPRNPLSPYYGLLGRNTPIRVGIGRVVDDFGRTVVDGWGTTSDSLEQWTLWALGGATAANFDVGSGVGTILTNGFRQIAYVGAYGDVDVVVKLSAATLGSNPDFGIATHVQSSGDCWFVALSKLTDTLTVQKFEGGGSAFYGPDYDIPGGIVAGTAYWLRVQHAGQLLRARVWEDGDPEPDVWHVTEWDDGALLGFVPSYGGVGCAVRGGSANVVSFDSFQVDSWRFHGEVAVWPPRWDISGNDEWAPIEATGITRRQERADALRSPVFREVTSAVNDGLTLGYWPCEDGASATQLASGLPSGSPMRIVGDASLSSNTSFPGSEPILTLTAAALVADIPPYVNTGTVCYRGLFDVPSAGFADGTLVVDIFCRAGGVARWVLRYGTGGSLILQAYDSANTLLDDSGIISFDVNGRTQMLGFQVEQDGADVHFGMFARRVEGDAVSEVGFDGVMPGLTVSTAAQVIIGNRVGLTDCGVGHPMVGNSTSLAITLEDAIVGYAGESARERMIRLCAEEGITMSIYSDDAAETAACGPQQSGALLQLLQDAADVDRGILYEPRDHIGLAYRPQRSLYNQPATLALDYAAGEIHPPFEPVDDDQQVVNDVTVSRISGSSARAVQETGPLNVNDPRDDPDGVGRYTQAPSLNASLDAQLPSIAGWIRHKGTWDEARWPAIAVNLARFGRDGKVALMAAAQAVNVGDLVSVDNLPVSVPPDLIEVLAAGHTETLNAYRQDIVFNALPAGPYRVFVLDDSVLGRLETGGSTVATDFDAGTDTSMSVTVTGDALWHTGGGHVPFDIMAAGVRLTVTAVAGGSSPQTFTITQTPVNGVVKTIPAGSAIKTAQLGALAL